ncbi:SIMPL domain-containing protein [Reichenbachiella ulvae]|uniref:SIMPL domain-containing protein n=1 Tax=Reichenbachiella ulvae TaxID=2980104 RepID=A0ABT3CWN1_9BACT|nr:SIMPL domain-containing protein [Reichenbachiella ulvae]MCV9388098.1 SIMPL domain-containing protein [Reichenbachiella ulvae]
MKSYLVLILFAFYSLHAFSQEGSKNFIDQNYIEVIGMAEKEIMPNEIYLKVVISEKDNKAKESLEQLESKMINKLEGIGLDIEKQLSIQDLGSNFQFYFLLKTDIFSTREYEILVYDAHSAAKVIVGLEEVGISNISISKMDHNDLESITMDLKQEAILNAKKKADKLSQALGQKAGRAIYIFEMDEADLSQVLSGRVAGLRIRGASSIYGSSAPKAANVNFDKIKIKSKIQVRFILE